MEYNKQFLCTYIKFDFLNCVWCFIELYYIYLNRENRLWKKTKQVLMKNTNNNISEILLKI